MVHSVYFSSESTHQQEETMNTANRRVADFLEVVTRCCELTNVKLVWGKGASLQCEGETRGTVAGYFLQPDGNKPGVLAVAKGRHRTKWLSVLAHEFGHMSQWFFNDPVWTNTTMPDGRDAAEIIDDWVTQYIELDPKEIADAFTRVRICELDADARAVQFIKDYKLPVNMEAYKKEIADMDYSYKLMERTRKWKRTKTRPGRLPTLKLI